MNEGKSSANWERLFDEVMAETDKEKLRKKAEELENAIFVRGQELQSDGGTDAERQGLNEAIQRLLKVRVEKLDFPLDPELLCGGARETQ